MSDEELGAEDEERAKSVPGEGGLPSPTEQYIPAVIIERHLTFEEASRCLNTLGKDESGMRYAYLMITATDRQLTHIDTILNFKHVLFVDVTNNLLDREAVKVLADMPYLIFLKAERNRVESAAFPIMPYLQVLILNRNAIEHTSEICQPMLDCLSLNYNQITRVLFDAERLPVLKQLEMRGNYLSDISGDYPPTIENLYLAENQINKIVPSEISTLVNLTILHLRDNHIRKLNGFTDSLFNLTYLNIRKNKITKFRQFRKLQCLPRLETLVVSQNPVAGEEEEKVAGGEEAEDEEGEEEKEDVTRIPILVLLPKLKRINKGIVSLEEREEALEASEEKLEEIMAEESSEDEMEPPLTMTDLSTTDYTDTENEGG